MQNRKVVIAENNLAIKNTARKLGNLIRMCRELEMTRHEVKENIYLFFRNEERFSGGKNVG